MAKQQNVEQQNADLQAKILRTAKMFEAPPKWLDTLLRTHRLEPAEGLLVKLSEYPEQGGGSWLRGIWLSGQLTFWEFEVVVSGLYGELRNLESFKNATTDIKFERGQPGTGKSFGYLALEVLRSARGA